MTQLKEEYTKLMVNVDVVDSEDVITTSDLEPISGGDPCWVCYM